MEDRRVTIREAAVLLGVSEGAIRKRVDRGTLEHDKGTDGRVYVYLPDGADNGVDASTPHESNALISEMKERIGFLEEELKAQRRYPAQHDQAMKALTSEPRGSCEASVGGVSASAGRGGDHVIPGAGEARFVVA